MFLVVLENSLSPAALAHGLRKECRALPRKNQAITRKRRGVDSDDSTLTLLMLPRTIKVASTCRKPSEGRSLKNWRGPMLHQFTESRRHRLHENCSRPREFRAARRATTRVTPRPP